MTTHACPLGRHGPLSPTCQQNDCWDLAILQGHNPHAHCPHATGAQAA